jgi:hypothetical protein
LVIDSIILQVSTNDLFKEFQQHSIFWFLLSGILGGFIGSFFKFIFEKVLSSKFDKNQSAKIALNKYSLPLLRSADSLDRRLENFIKFSDKKWFISANDDYYKISTLYSFGQFFGYAGILDKEAFLEFNTNKKQRRFHIGFYRVFKGLTGFVYFKNTTNTDLPELDKANIPRFVLTAIGELMIRKYSPKEHPEILSFIEFSKMYEKNKDFKKWFAFIENLINKATSSSSNAYWNRIIIFHINLRLLICYLDPKNRYTGKRYIDFLDNLNPNVKAIIEKEIDESGFANLIKKVDQD